MSIAAPQTRWQIPPAKRWLDLLLVIPLLLLALPLMLLVAAGIKLSSPGPVLYRSQRRGLGGKNFEMLKFRSMCNHADQQQQELESSNQADGVLFKIRKDPRITGLGTLLRRFSIDELPQLWNVLRGEMSLVGPRPLPERDYHLLPPAAQVRYQVLPGMTGLWQVSGRSDLSSEEMVQLDSQYVTEYSLHKDLRILLLTIPAVINGRGAC